jgi:hypothetical protein
MILAVKTTSGAKNLETTIAEIVDIIIAVVIVVTLETGMMISVAMGAIIQIYKKFLQNAPKFQINKGSI